MDRIRRKSVFAYVAFPLFLALIAASIVVFHDQLWGVFRDREAIRGWIEGRGIWGPLAFIALQVVQVVIFVIPGEIVQVAGGYVFGFWVGSLYTLIGITLGSLANFYAGRLLGRPFVESLFAKDKIEKVEAVTGSGKAAAGFFLLFVIPGIPKDVLCYVAGVSKLRFFAFLGVSMAGRLPGILGSSYMGSAAFAGAWRGAIIVLVVAAALFALGLAFRERIQTFVSRLLHKSPPPSPRVGLRYHCLVVDHDDTSVMSTAKLHYPAHVEAMRRLRPGLEPISLDGWLARNFDPGLMAYLQGELGMDEAELRQNYLIWREYTDSMVSEFYPGLLEVYAEHRRRGGLLVVVSHSAVDMIERDYRSAGAAVPDLVFGWDDDPDRRKPHPYPLLAAIERFGLQRKDILMLDDLKPGADMAAAAGVDFAAAGWGHSIPEIRKAMQGHSLFYLESVGDLRALLFGQSTP
jgi:phosphoglycolate phosphatase/pyrophosphatase PpaX